ncbi:hypothetical protein RND81_14G209700 [Saponaria officinalis]|uniref:Uncharacterized protein n=1 Tax=Saponaria officinalis TaxID=3572 RepID=A0AAW1GS81_SAPOF
MMSRNIKETTTLEKWFLMYSLNNPKYSLLKKTKPSTLVNSSSILQQFCNPHKALHFPLLPTSQPVFSLLHILPRRPPLLCRRRRCPGKNRKNQDKFGVSATSFNNAAF